MAPLHYHRGPTVRIGRYLPIYLTLDRNSIRGFISLLYDSIKENSPSTYLIKQPAAACYHSTQIYFSIGTLIPKSIGTLSNTGNFNFQVTGLAILRYDDNADTSVSRWVAASEPQGFGWTSRSVVAIVLATCSSMQYYVYKKRAPASPLGPFGVIVFDAEEPESNYIGWHE